MLLAVQIEWDEGRKRSRRGRRDVTIGMESREIAGDGAACGLVAHRGSGRRSSSIGSTCARGESRLSHWAGVTGPCAGRCTPMATRSTLLKAAPCAGNAMIASRFGSAQS